MVKKSVVSMSLGGTFNAAVNQAATAMYNGGMTVVVAAGNSGDNACNYSPASAVGAITVAATDSMDTRPTWSNYGSCVNLHAPGVSIFSAWNSCDTCYNIIDGTSMGTLTPDSSIHLCLAYTDLLFSHPSRCRTLGLFHY